MATQTADLQQLYVAYFGRPADAGGLAYWDNALKTNPLINYQSVSHEFSQSPEFQQKYAGMDNRAILNEIYHNLFARDGDVDGLNYWTAPLNDHSLSLDQIIAFITLSAQAPDRALLDGKVAVANAFTQHMDQPNEQAAYLQPAGMQVGHDFLAAVTTTGEAQFDLNSPGLIDSAIAQFSYSTHSEAPHAVQLVGVHDAGLLA